MALGFLRASFAFQVHDPNLERIAVRRSHFHAQQVALESVGPGALPVNRRPAHERDRPNGIREIRRRRRCPRMSFPSIEHDVSVTHVGEKDIQKPLQDTFVFHLLQCQHVRIQLPDRGGQRVQFVPWLLRR